MVQLHTRVEILSQVINSNICRLMNLERCLIISGKFKDFVESDGFGTFTWKDGTIYFGPMMEGSFDTTGMICIQNKKKFCKLPLYI